MPETHTIILVSQDGKEESFECAEDAAVLSAAEAAEITIPAGCRKGMCGSCRGRCSQGNYELRSFSEDILSESDRERDEVLLCQTFPKGPLTIEVPVDHAQLVAGPIPEFSCELLSNEELGGSVRRLRLKALPDETGSINTAFEPGQFLELQIPGTETQRAYSLANAPNWSGDMEFLIRLQPDGLFSSWLDKEARPGDTLRACGPQGDFTIKEGSLAPRRFVAGGTGVAPMFSMLRQMSESQETQDARLYFGLNTEEEIFAKSELDELEASLSNLSVQICIWTPGPDWQGFTGSPVDALKIDLVDDLAKGTQPEVYLCGPPGMVNAALAMIEDVGLPAENVFSERFVAN
ncbi:MAG: 2Fe-2S iron-sulfur cluster binding domain-containing protein [bacterium]|nr:oxidoreductase [Deltaproteobacteria bacterium]MCP4906231.1 2Fe-2S iron-sulfur cluster binding domain-containing protein [bacterium]